MTPKTKEAANATYAATKELLISTADVMVAFFHFSVKFTVLTYHLGQDVRAGMDAWLEEQQRRTHKLIGPGLDDADIIQGEIIETPQATVAPIIEPEPEPKSKSKPKTKPTPVPQPTYALDLLPKMTLEQLRDIAIPMGIEVKKMRKAELIKELENRHPENHLERQESQANTNQFRSNQTETQIGRDKPKKLVENPTHYNTNPTGYSTVLTAA